MTVGTRSVLYGAHAFWLHPFFVALAWWKLYGFPWDPRHWVAFFVHDLGYLGCSKMDDEEGELHPWLGARIMSALFDGEGTRPTLPLNPTTLRERSMARRLEDWLGEWGRFALFHSRFLSKRYGAKPSRLCIADKLAIALEPWWLYLPRVILTGEVREYMAQRADAGKYRGEPNTPEEDRLVRSRSRREWHRGMTSYCRRWAYEHRDGRQDTWTPAGAS